MSIADVGDRREVISKEDVGNQRLLRASELKTKQSKTKEKPQLILQNTPSFMMYTSVLRTITTSPHLLKRIMVITLKTKNREEEGERRKKEKKEEKGE